MLLSLSVFYICLFGHVFYNDSICIVIPKTGTYRNYASKMYGNREAQIHENYIFFVDTSPCIFWLSYVEYLQFQRDLGNGNGLI